MANKADMQPGGFTFGGGRHLFSPNEWTAGHIQTFAAAAGIGTSHYHAGYGNWALNYVASNASSTR
jgi:hypothetical protein